MASHPPPAPGPREKRLAAFLEGLAQAAGHRDRWQPLKNYCLGLPLPGERKSVEPMAARLAPDNVRRMHQSLHHVVADAAWSDRNLLSAVWHSVWPTRKRRGPVVAWVVGDTGFPKKGRHSVGVARQYCGQVGKRDNCRVAVSLSISTRHSSLPVAYDLYLPESWASDKKRRAAAKVPDEIEFRTKPWIAAEQIRAALNEAVPPAPVLADAAYGNDSKFREALSAMGLDYLVGVQSTLSVWPPGMDPLKPKEWKGEGRRPKLLRRCAGHQPILAGKLAREVPSNCWKKISWRKGTKETLRSRFAAVRVRPAHRDFRNTEPWPEQWLLMEWPEAESAPTNYWLGTMPSTISLKELAALAKHRWIIERDYEELKQELGLGHFEGRGWRGFHHHATLCIAAYGFLAAERSRFSPSTHPGQLQLALPQVPPGWHPRGSRSTA